MDITVLGQSRKRLRPPRSPPEVGFGIDCHILSLGPCEPGVGPGVPPPTRPYSLGNAHQEGHGTQPLGASWLGSTQPCRSLTVSQCLTEDHKSASLTGSSRALSEVSYIKCLAQCLTPSS